MNTCFHLCRARSTFVCCLCSHFRACVECWGKGGGEVIKRARLRPCFVIKFEFVAGPKSFVGIHVFFIWPAVVWLGFLLRS